MLAEKMVPSEKQQQFAQTLKVQADRLSHLVENVLQFAKLERGPGDETKELVDVDALIERMSSRLKERSLEAGMELSIKIEPQVAQQQLKTRSATVEQIVFNLVDNACKYARSSTDKRIQLRCGKGNGKVRISVRDFGPGVPDKDRSRMFQPFCKSDQDAANTAPGVGLGLALCRRMAVSLGGQLKFVQHDEGDGGGAEFVFLHPVDLGKTN